MSLQHQLMKTCQDDAARAGERDRLRLEVKRARLTLRHRPGPDAMARRLIRLLLLRRVTTAPRTLPPLSRPLENHANEQAPARVLAATAPSERAS